METPLLRALVVGSVVMVTCLAGVGCGTKVDVEQVGAPTIPTSPRRVGTVVPRSTTAPPTTPTTVDHFQKLMKDAAESGPDGAGDPSPNAGSGGGRSASAAGGASPGRLGSTECDLFAQLILFTTTAQDLVDPNDPVATAQKLSEPVAQNSGRLDQIMASSPVEIRADVDSVVSWLRARAEGRAAGSDSEAGAALGNIRAWHARTCT